MAGPTLTLPTVGGSNNTWGTTVNAALNQINDYEPFAYKTADQTITSSITLTDDTHMALALPAAGTYVVEGMFMFSGAAAGDIKIAWAYTGTLTNGYRSGQGPSTVSTDVLGAAANAERAAAAGATTAAITSSTPYGCDGTNWSAAFELGVVIVSTTGTLKVQWAQQTSNATGTVMRAGSFFRARRVA